MVCNKVTGFPTEKGGLLCKVKERKEWRGGIHRYAAQAIPQRDAEIAQKNPFWTAISV